MAGQIISLILNRIKKNGIDRRADEKVRRIGRVNDKREKSSIFLSGVWI